MMAEIGVMIEVCQLDVNDKIISFVSCQVEMLKKKVCVLEFSCVCVMMWQCSCVCL